MTLSTAINGSARLEKNFFSLSGVERSTVENSTSFPFWYPFWWNRKCGEPCGGRRRRVQTPGGFARIFFPLYKSGYIADNIILIGIRVKPEGSFLLHMCQSITSGREFVSFDKWNTDVMGHIGIRVTIGCVDIMARWIVHIYIRLRPYKQGSASVD